MYIDRTTNLSALFGTPDPPPDEKAKAQAAALRDVLLAQYRNQFLPELRTAARLLVLFWKQTARVQLLHDQLATLGVPLDNVPKVLMRPAGDVVELARAMVEGKLIDATDAVVADLL